MLINRRLSFSLLATLAGLTIASHAADLVAPEPTQTGEEKGIWGAIAFSPADGRHGFFWGADKRDEAEDIALKHCENADGAGCEVVEVFRNHRHWDDDDGTGFPYEHCAALSVGKNASAGKPFWGAASAITRREAEDKALTLCGGKEKECKIREWVCT
ncbi:DUF4189 domain-containing protein [Mesorhizobium sp. MSK_1335]|uniref:DUF4189 domain-containing protein n=1 Tax=Mesorhizobium montanum TaxID=3072323 RepID=A0ABU4ZIU3_9HYPH|nr:DUF4189 domain-containing protein [Mesorhizobium sp. MSK_1335]MDX8524562.1 DUF4189 domain-containing protein [Mesorhizobium sp. MSK_1335]